MMSPQIALHDPVFRAYFGIVTASLLVGGLVLSLLHWGLKKETSAMWKTYRSWLIMAPVGSCQRISPSRYVDDRSGMDRMNGPNQGRNYSNSASPAGFTSESIK